MYAKRNIKISKGTISNHWHSKSCILMSSTTEKTKIVAEEYSMFSLVLFNIYLAQMSAEEYNLCTAHPLLPHYPRRSEFRFPTPPRKKKPILNRE